MTNRITQAIPGASRRPGRLALGRWQPPLPALCEIRPQAWGSSV